MKKELLFLATCFAILGLLLVKTLREGRWASLAGAGNAAMLCEIGKDRIFSGSETAQIDRIELRRPDDILVFVRRAGFWKMQTPLETPADEGKIQALLDLLKVRDDPSAFRVPIAKGGASQESTLSLFGMGRPKTGVQFSGPAGQETLWLGERAPQEQGVYARWMNESFVSLVDARLAEMVAAPVSAWREQRMFHKPGTSLKAVSLRKKSQVLDLLSDGNAIWRRDTTRGVSEISHRADPAALKEVFEFFNHAVCIGFWDEKTKVLSREVLLKIRLDREGAGQVKDSAYVLEKIVTPDAEKWVVSDSAGDGRYIAVPGDFSKYLNDFLWIMDKGWTSLRAEDCRYLSFAGQGKALSLARDDGAWGFGADPGLRADQAKVQAFLEKLLCVQVRDFVPVREIAAGAGLVMEIGESPQDAMRLTVAKEGNAWTAHRKGDAFLMQWDAQDMDFSDCLEQDHWRDRAIWPFAAGAITGVDIVRPDSKLHMVQEQGAWRIQGPAPLAGIAQEALLSKALRRLLPLEAVRFLGAKERQGLSKFKVRVKLALRPEGSQAKWELWLGNKVQGGVLAKIPKQESIFVLPEKSVALFLQNPNRFVHVLKEDANKDGKTDVWTIFYRGARYRQRIDTDWDGRPDISKRLNRYPQAEKTPDGKTDYLEKYQGQGGVIHQGLRGA